MASPLHVKFVGGASGSWRVLGVTAIVGDGLARPERVDVRESASPAPSPLGAWTLSGVTSNHRYVERAEATTLTRVQATLGRPEATRAALIPIKKSDAWWSLAQDERRAIFEARSQHIAGTLRFLPAIARRLHHARELGEPFDFLTWFEWAPEYDALFDELVGFLRESEEWKYVEREVDVRLARA